MPKATMASTTKASGAALTPSAFARARSTIRAKNPPLMGIHRFSTTLPRIVANNRQHHNLEFRVIGEAPGIGFRLRRPCSRPPLPLLRLQHKELVGARFGAPDFAPAARQLAHAGGAIGQ